MSTPPGGLSTLQAWKPILAADPAANTEVLATVPAGKSWLLASVSVQLVQGITNTPQPILVIDDGTNVFYESFGSSAAQAVSTTCRYTWAPDSPLTGQVGVTTGVHSTAPLPQALILGPGYRVRTSTLGLAATADYGVPVLYVCEFG